MKARPRDGGSCRFKTLENNPGGICPWAPEARLCLFLGEPVISGSSPFLAKCSLFLAVDRPYPAQVFQRVFISGAFWNSNGAKREISLCPDTATSSCRNFGTVSEIPLEVIWQKVWNAQFIYLLANGERLKKKPQQWQTPQQSRDKPLFCKGVRSPSSAEIAWTFFPFWM